jgi:hypothetical protein
MRFNGFLIFFFGLIYVSRAPAQTAWPSEAWSNAVNLTGVMDAGGLTELSGLFWNDVTDRLYVSHGDGRLRVLQFNAGNNAFSQIGNIGYSGGPEGITQVNLSANEFYTIDEDNYQIRKYTHPSNFSSVTLAKSWNILLPPSTMTNTGNTGPEGIAFIPDSFLNAVGFISSVSGLPYTSVKGMGGLLFIAHQNQGYVWVFDVNPSVSNDFAFVGKYKTNKSESCDLAFDRTTGLLYILHNTGGNFLEVTDLTTTLIAVNERKFTVLNEYYVANPSGNQNVEGFAITRKCDDISQVSVWLCRDVEATESATYKLDCLRWFNPFTAPGYCAGTAVTLNLKLYIQGYYLGSGLMKAVIDEVNHPAWCDTITLELHASSGSHGLAYSCKGVIDVNGNGSFVFPSQVYGQAYYLVVKHRNALESWSALPVFIHSATVSYSFASAASQAYGGNQSNLGGGNYGLYSGDVDQNGTIDGNDFSSVESRTRLFLSGYLNDDLSGDRLVESTDYDLMENNYLLQIAVSRP